MSTRRRVWAAAATALLMVAGLALASAAATGSVVGGPSLNRGDAVAVPDPAPADDPGTAELEGPSPVTRPVTDSAALAPSQETAPPDEPEAALTSPPARLTVPAIDVDAQVAGVGVDPDGGMEVIEDIERVGWYEHGPVPGASGSSVLAAHVDTEEGRGVFFDLVELEVGDKVEVRDADGTLQRFEISAVDRHHKDELPVEELFARDGPGRLTLITCGGPFDPEQRSYRDNVVVTALPA